MPAQSNLTNIDHFANPLNKPQLTQRKKAEQEIMHSNSTLENLMNHAPFGMYLLDAY